MKDQPSSAHCRTCGQSRPRVAAIIALLVLTAFLGTSHFRQGVRRQGGSESAGWVSEAAVSQPSERAFYYFRSGQWQADLRTLLSACRFLLQPDWA